MTTIADATNVHPIVSNWITFIKAHETLLIIILVLGSSLFVAQKYFDLSAKIEDHKAQQAAAALTAQTQTTNTDIAQVKQLLATYQDAIAASAKQNAQLQAQINNRNLDLTKQQNADKVLSPSQLASRWVSQVKDPGVAATTAGYTVSDSAAIATVEALEQVPVLQQDLTDEQSKEKNLQLDLNAANDLVTKGKQTAAAIALEEQDKDKACSAQVNALKADARKSKLKWFFGGVITGFVLGHVW